MRAGEAISILAIQGTERQQFFLRLANAWFDELPPAFSWRSGRHGTGALGE